MPGAALQELAPCPGVSLDFPKLGVFKASPGTVPSSWLSPERLCSEGQELGWSPLGAAVIRAARTCCPQQGLSLGAKPLGRTGLLTGVTVPGSRSSDPVMSCQNGRCQSLAVGGEGHPAVPLASDQRPPGFGQCQQVKIERLWFRGKQ